MTATTSTTTATAAEGEGRIFIGRRTLEGAQAYVVDLDGVPRLLSPRLDLAQHFADGFDWGGPGAAVEQLGVALAADALGDDWTALAAGPRVVGRMLVHIRWNWWVLRPALVRALCGDNEVPFGEGSALNSLTERERWAMNAACAALGRYEFTAPAPPARTCTPGPGEGDREDEADLAERYADDGGHADEVRAGNEAWVRQCEGIIAQQSLFGDDEAAVEAVTRSMRRTRRRG